MRRLALGKALEVLIVAVERDDPDLAERMADDAKLALPAHDGELSEASRLAYECWDYDRDIDDYKRRIVELFEEEGDQDADSG